MVLAYQLQWATLRGCMSCTLCQHLLQDHVPIYEHARLALVAELSGVPPVSPNSAGNPFWRSLGMKSHGEPSLCLASCWPCPFFLSMSDMSTNVSRSRATPQHCPCQAGSDGSSGTGIGTLPPPFEASYNEYLPRWALAW